MGVGKEGGLVKQSKHMSRGGSALSSHRSLRSFKNQGAFRNPTEHIRLRECSTMKSVEDETGKENAFHFYTQDHAFYLIVETPMEEKAWNSTIGRQMVRSTVPTEHFE